MNTNELLDQAVAQAKEKNAELFILISTAKDGQGLWTNINGVKYVAASLMDTLVEITKQEGHTEFLNELRGIIDSVEKSITESTTN